LGNLLSVNPNSLTGGLFPAPPITTSVFPHPSGKPLGLEAGIASDFQDFEDAVLAAAGRIANVDAIITRNAKDFRKAGLPVYNAAQAVELLLSRERG